MNTQTTKELEIQMKNFAERHFTKPSDCKNLEQIQFYISELCLKIKEFETRFQYVPQVAYVLLNQYNMRQNAFVSERFRMRQFV